MVVKTAFFVSRGDFWRTFHFFTKSSSFLVAFRLWGKHFEFFVELIWLGCQNCFQVSRDIFGRVVFWKQILWNVSFLDFGHKIFGLSAKTFQQVRQNCFLCVQRRFLIELFFYEFFEFLFVFGLWGKHSETMTQEALESLSELQSKCTKETSEKNLFFVEKFHIYSFFEPRSNTLRTFVEQHSIRFQKLISTFVRGFFLHIIIIFLYAY